MPDFLDQTGATDRDDGVSPPSHFALEAILFLAVTALAAAIGAVLF
jgi:hypothetical protein